MSPADLADLRRRTLKPQKTTLIPISLYLRNDAACCIPLRYLRETMPLTYVKKEAK